MFIEKSVQTTVNFTEPNVIYTPDIDSAIMDNLKQRFEGYCYSSCLVTEVVRIEDRGNLIFSRQRQDASATCSVRFIVKGLILQKNEMLHDCIVLKIDKDGHIICKNKHAVIYIKAAKALQTIKTGQTIVVLAGMVKYKLFKPSISVNALPFIPVFHRHAIYRVTAAEHDILKGLYAELEAEIKINAKLGKQVYSFFMDLMYPYASSKELDDIKDAKTTPIKSLLKMEGELLISVPDCLPLGQPDVLVHKKVNTEDVLGTTELMGVEGKTAEESLVTSEEFVGVVGKIISDKIRHLQTIRHLCTTYYSMEEIKKNNNIWDIYKRYRRP
jgi:hypothetical protein